MQEEKKDANALDGLIAVGGKPGLYRIVGQGKSGALVEALSDGRRQVIGASAKVSALRDIAIYTSEKEKPLAEVFESMAQLDIPMPGNKANPEELFGFFEKVLPDFDREKVYASDVRKVIRWYEEFRAHGISAAAAQPEATRASVVSEDEDQTEAEELASAREEE